MFYTQKSIDSKLTCLNCERRYDVPKMLPCNQSICISCERLLIREKKLKCPICTATHRLAEDQNEFPINEFINSMLNIKPIKLSRDDLLNLLNKITTKLMSLKEDENINGSDKLKEYCEILKIQIDIETENQIMKLNDERDALIKHIENYQEECKIKSYKEDFKSEYQNFTNYCFGIVENCQRILHSSDNELEEDYKKLKALEADLTSFEYKLKHRMFNGQIAYLEKPPNENENELLKVKLRKKSLKINLDLEKIIKTKFFKYEHKCEFEKNMIVRNVSMTPVCESSILIVTECYNWSNPISYLTELCIYDIVADFKFVQKNQLTKHASIESYDSTKHDIALVFTDENNSSGLELYNNKLELVETKIIDYQPKCVKFSDENLIYVLSSTDKIIDEICFDFHIFAYDLSLNLVANIGPISDIKNIYSIVSINQSKLILSENEGEKFYVYCEKSRKLSKTLLINTHSSAFYIDPINRLYLLHRKKKTLTVINLNIDENSEEDHLILLNSTLEIDTNYLDSFCVINNGHLIIQDSFRGSDINFFIFA